MKKWIRSLALVVAAFTFTALPAKAQVGYPCEAGEFSWGGYFGVDGIDAEGDVVVAGCGSAEEVSVLRRCGSDLVLSQTIKGDAFSDLGSSVLLEDEFLFVGAPGSESVSVYVDGPSGFQPLQTLVPPTPPPFVSLFGKALACDGDVLVVSAPNRSITGRLYVYDLVGGLWQYSTTLAPVASTFFLRTGQDLSLRGETIVAGVDDLGPQQFGGAFVFRRESGIWSQVATIEPSPAGSSSEIYGSTVEMTSATSFLMNASSASFAGQDYILDYREIGGVWVEFDRIADPAGVRRTKFPSDLDATEDGLRFVASGPALGEFGVLRGEVLQYELDSTGRWALDQVYFNPDWGSFIGLEYGNAITDRWVTTVWSGGLSNSLLRSTAVDGRSCAGLSTQLSSVSLSSGATGSLEIDFGSNAAGAIYHALGSVSGTNPGLELQGTCVPLVLDTYFLDTLVAIVPPLTGSIGLLDGQGQASVGINVPAGTDPALVGLEVSFAAVSYSLSPLSLSEATNAVSMQLIP